MGITVVGIGGSGYYGGGYYRREGAVGITILKPGGYCSG